jgi:hypothetical protein
MAFTEEEKHTSQSFWGLESAAFSITTRAVLNV